MIHTVAISSSPYWPLFVLLLSVSWVVFGITKLKIQNPNMK